MERHVIVWPLDEGLPEPRCIGTEEERGGWYRHRRQDPRCDAPDCLGRSGTIRWRHWGLVAQKGDAEKEEKMEKRKGRGNALA